MAFWPESSARNIVHSGIASAPHMGQIHEIYMGPRRGYGKTLNDRNLRTFDPTYMSQAFREMNVWCNFHGDLMRMTWVYGQARTQTVSFKASPSFHQASEMLVTRSAAVTHNAYNYFQNDDESSAIHVLCPAIHALRPVELMHLLFTAPDPDRTSLVNIWIMEENDMLVDIKRQASDQGPLGLSVWFDFCSHQMGLRSVQHCVETLSGYVFHSKHFARFPSAILNDVVWSANMHSKIMMIL